MSFRTNERPKKVYDCSHIGYRRNTKSTLSNMKIYRKHVISILKYLDNLLILQEQIIRNKYFSKEQRHLFRLFISKVESILEYTIKYNKKYIKPSIEELSSVNLSKYFLKLQKHDKMLSKSKYTKFTFDKNDLINDINRYFKDLNNSIIGLMMFSNTDSYDHYSESIIGEYSSVGENLLKQITKLS